MRHRIRQSELASLIGFERSYVSALEIGTKGPPTEEFIDKLVSSLALSPSERDEIRDAVSASQRKLVIGPDCPTDVFWMLRDLREQLEELHPVQIKMIRDALQLRGVLPERPVEPPRRIKRRRKEEVQM